MSVTATLYYGFELGCPENGGWKVQEADQWGDLEGIPWVEAAEDDDEEYIEHMMVALLAEADIEAAEMSLIDLKAAVEEHWGVTFVLHGHFSSGQTHIGIALRDTVYEADDWTPKAIAPSTHGQNHMLLVNALKALGLTPKQANPSWILAPGEH